MNTDFWGSHKEKPLTRLNESKINEEVKRI